jgi:hypothetical protein
MRFEGLIVAHATTPQGQPCGGGPPCTPPAASVETWMVDLVES